LFNSCTPECNFLSKGRNKNKGHIKALYSRGHKSIMTIPSEIRHWHNRMQPAKGHQTENERAKIAK
jgi:hypothetical protein